MPEAVERPVTRLGTIIRYFRISRDWSQEQLAEALDWDDVKLNRLEAGKGLKPSKDAIDLIIGRLRLDNEERVDLLAAGGYLPEPHEVELVQASVKHILLASPYPAYLEQFTWDLIDANTAAFDLFGVPEEQGRQMISQRPNLLELIFTSDCIRERITPGGWTDFIRHEIAKFKATHGKREEEPWYQELYSRLSRLEEFRREWASVPKTLGTQCLMHYGEITLQIDPKDHDSRIRFFESGHPVVIDRRFKIVLLKPTDRRSFEVFERYFGRRKLSTPLGLEVPALSASP